MSRRYQSIFVAFVVIAYVVIAHTASSASAQGASGQSEQTLAIPPDSPRWQLEGQAKAAEYQGRKCLFLDGGAAILKDFEMRDGVLDVDVATTATRGFFGFDFRIDSEGANITPR